MFDLDTFAGELEMLINRHLTRTPGCEHYRSVADLLYELAVKIDHAATDFEANIKERPAAEIIEFVRPKSGD
jgi:hypothetical protein